MKAAGKAAQVQRLRYRLSEEQNIINPFSPDGYELLSASFLSFVDLMCPSGGDGAPILLELTGKEPDAAQQKAIERAIRLHYRLRMTRLAGELKACRIKTLWFFICTVLSSVFLYLVTKQTGELELQFFYLPIWFFGYRLLTYPLQEYLPMRRDLRRCRRLAAMTVVFTRESEPALSEAQAAGLCSKNSAAYTRAMEGIRRAELTRSFTKDDGSVELSCHAPSAQALLNPCSTPENPLVSEELAAYLNQAEPFMQPDRPAALTVCGAALSEEEKSAVTAAAANYFRLRCLQADSALKQERRKIISYTLCLMAACLLLYFGGKSVGLGMHEFMLISLWFFADYLLEFLLLGLSGTRATVRLRRRLMYMQIDFIR